MSGSSKDQVLRIVHSKEVQEKRYAYHAHDAREVLSVLASSPEGLTESAVLKRLKADGPNAFTPQKQTLFVVKILKQLQSPLALVLVVAFLVTLALQEFVDAFVISFALLIAVVVGVLQEGKASNAFQKLADSQVRRATVLRAGAKHEIDGADLVRGDVVVLQSGARIPADLRLIETKQLKTNEATLTGEWRGVDKQAKPVQQGTPLALRASMAYMGTYVAEGYGLGVVVATGDSTEVGKLASSMRDVVEVATPLQDEMRRLSQKMLVIIVGLIVAIFVIGMLTGQGLNDMLLMSIAIAVAAVPEGLPAAVTIILAVGMEALLRRGGLVRNLLAAETLGSTTYVLTDKTGTLTEGQMAITGLVVGDGELVLANDFSKYDDAAKIFQMSLAATDAYVDTQGAKRVVRGDAEERTIYTVAETLPLESGGETWQAVRTDYLPFTSEQRYAAGLVPQAAGNILCVNGAPNVLLHAATKRLVDGTVVPLESDTKQALRQVIEAETSQGHRLIAVGYKDVSYEAIPEHKKTLIEELIFVGVLVFSDPVRQGVEQAIAGVQSAGARVVLITGDNPQTALSIARATGITDDEGVALTGSDLETLTDDEVKVALAEVSVFARVLPEQKLRIASVLQQQGEIVAMTGDGINDAPALRRANIGIAVGSGTEVAKEASDLVLLTNSFDVIYAAIEEGRRIVSNLRKIVGYLISTSLSEVVIIAAALLTGGAIPLLPAQILWANVIEEGLMSVAFAFEKGEKGAMRRKPRDVHEEGLISRAMLLFIMFVVSTLAVLNLALYFYIRSLDVSTEVLQSIMFLSIAIDSLFISFSFRSLSVPLWRIPLLSNLFFVGAFLLSLVLLAVVLTVPFFQYLLSYTPLPAQFILLPVLASAASMLLVELAKWLFFERQK